MNFAIKYYKNCPILDKVNEIIIKYNEKDSELINFAKEKTKEDQRLVINICQLDSPIEENIDIFKAIIKIKQSKNFAIKCLKDQNYSLFQENNIPFFFSNGAETWDELIGQISCNVSDIYIINELGFSLHKIAQVFKDKVNIRVYPDIVQSSSELYKNTLKCFFIRPEDLFLYENIIDTIEFFDDRLNVQPTLYNIYAREAWNDDLSIPIKGLDKNIDSSLIIPLFGQTRLNCGKRCALNKCSVCDHAEIIAGKLELNDIYIEKQPKDLS